jgi:hypothetical protein
MKITKELLTKFLDLTIVGGEIENKEAILNMNDNMEVLTVTEGKHFAIKGTLDSNCEKLGTLGLDNLKDFQSFIKNFDSNIEINISKKDNKLILESADSKLLVEYMLKSPEYIVNSISNEKFANLLKLSKGNEFIIEADTLKKIISYANSMKSSSLRLAGKNKQITLTLDDEKENTIISKFDIKEEIKIPFSIKVSKMLVNILKTINNTIIMSIKDGCPLLIQYLEEGKGYKLNFSYLLALLNK